MPTTNKIVVYTCITDGYDYLKEIPEKLVSDPRFEFVCFTDDPNLKSKTWKIRPIPSLFSRLSKVKQQRLTKIRPDLIFPEFSESLWIDGSIKIIGDLNQFIDSCDLGKSSFWSLKHPMRNCIYDEELECLRLRKDVQEKTRPQITRYLNEGYPRNNGLIESRVIFRSHHNDLCSKTMLLWATEVLGGSHRDQLSFNYCSWKTGLEYMTFDPTLTHLTFQWNSRHPKSKLSEDLGQIGLYTVNFNQTVLTNILLKSIVKNVINNDYRLYVVDNSTTQKFVLDQNLSGKVTVIDNTNDKIIPLEFSVKNFSKIPVPVNNNGSFKHCLTIQWILDQAKENHIVLFDCDVVLKKNLDWLDSNFLTIAQTEDLGKSKPRFLPYLQYFNIKMLRKLKIRYFDPMLIHGGLTKPGNYYDTGASFYEEIIKKNLPWDSIDLSDHINHLKGGTFRSEKIDQIKKFISENFRYWG